MQKRKNERKKERKAGENKGLGLGGDGRTLRRRASGGAEVASSLAAPDPEPLSLSSFGASERVSVCSGI